MDSAPPLLPSKADCPVIFLQKPLEELPWCLSAQASTGYAAAALAQQPPPRAPVTAAPSDHLEEFMVSPSLSQGQKSL